MHLALAVSVLLVAAGFPFAWYHQTFFSVKVESSTISIPPAPPVAIPSAEHKQNVHFIKTSSTSASSKHAYSSSEHQESALHVDFFAPFFSGGGYCSEATEIVAGLLNYSSTLPASSPLRSLRIHQHGDGQSQNYLRGLLPSIRQMLETSLRHTPSPQARSVAICHSSAWAWNPSFYPDDITGSPCPPPSSGRIKPYLVGRTMLEGYPIPREFASRLKAMDEVWVPSAFVRTCFDASGVPWDKMHVIPESVNQTFWSPKEADAFAASANLPPLPLPASLTQKRPFIFLSMFKWEERKGWAPLLKAFAEEFEDKDNVVLLIISQPFDDTPDIRKAAAQFLQTVSHKRQGHPANVILYDKPVSSTVLRHWYRQSNAFVLATRAEASGKAFMEAMLMELPTIGTGWGGQSEFMTSDNSFIVNYVLRPIPSDLQHIFGSSWADPLVSSLRHHFRDVYENQGKARQIGVKARQDLLDRYSSEKMLGLILNRLHSISQTMSRTRKIRNE